MSKSNSQKKSKTIRRQLLNSFIGITLGAVLIFAISAIYLAMINIQYKSVEINTHNEASTQGAIAAHYEWLDNLNLAIQTGSKFTGSLDHTTCGLGKWISEVDPEDIKDPVIAQALNDLMTPHEYIHKNAQSIIDMSKNNTTSAFKRYSEEIKPQGMKVIENLNIITGAYQKKSNSSATLLKKFMTSSFIVCGIISLITVVASLFFANRISKKISDPILAVSDWSKKLAIGVDDLEIENMNITVDHNSEIGTMIDSFKLMVESVQNNVNVVRRVADGDMTAFVNIRSKEDSLGKNLYRMVQSNNALFTDIIRISKTVATASGQIANTSQSIAQSASYQAEAVQNLSTTIDMAASLTMENADKSIHAARISEQMRIDANKSNDMMIELVSAVNEISASSQKISKVIKSIDDIAFQTNILALNAAVEAARAGEAGKGFAVVADEVRNLALKSAEAANETKALIEDSIHKVDEGSKISHETAGTVGKIIVSLNEIAELVTDIADASNTQTEGVKQIRTEITHIADGITSNVAISEESAAASQEMSGNADLLNEEMAKFNLRQRMGEGAYIPPEKRNDKEFIRIANESYRKAVETGQYGFEYLDPDFKKIAEAIS